tara:strand:- start:145 stop:408 length:264 start_codon:yes stop_codon:yes gene_type:complete
MKYRPFQRRYLGKEKVISALKETSSLSKASEACEVSYPTFRRFAKLYKDDDGISLYDKYKNQSGKGITKTKRFKTDKHGNKINLEIS